MAFKSKKSNGTTDNVKLRGFFRVQLTEAGKGVVGDSGWNENQTTDNGVRDYLVKAMLGSAGSLSVSYLGLGTGTAPGTTATTLDGELFHNSTNATVNSRASATTSITASRTAVMTAAFLSANSFVTATANISNVGLFNSYLTSLANVGTLLAGNTFASSSCATNQSVKHLRHLLAMVGRKLRKFGESLKQLVASLKTIPSQAYAIA